MTHTDVDPLAHLAVGDDAEPVRGERRQRRAPGCLRRHPATRTLCTRAWGHPGQHIAAAALTAGGLPRFGGPSRVCAAWPPNQAVTD